MDQNKWTPRDEDVRRTTIESVTDIKDILGEVMGRNLYNEDVAML